MVGATVLGVFLQGLPPDRRVAMARVASLIRRAARGVRESKRFGLVFYELNGGPLFALESREKSLTLYMAEKDVVTPLLASVKGFDADRCLVEFTDLNRLPLPNIEKIVRASVLARRERGTAPAQSDILSMWGVKEEEAAVAPPVVRISMRTAEDEAAEAAAKAEADRLAAESKKILRPTKPEKSLVQKRQAAAAATKAEAKSTVKSSPKAEVKSEADKPVKAAAKPAAKKTVKVEEKADAEKTVKTAAKKAVKAKTETAAEKSVKTAAKKSIKADGEKTAKTAAKKTVKAKAETEAEKPAKKTTKTAAKKSTAKKTAE
ncbi:MAG: DUF1801 domain-containing protein [Duodenibacillus sp.]|nr:DUF1801 domain-containing protein [Duodenibacillus sp.]